MKDKVSYPIDFVLPWLDGNDSNWLAAKNAEMGKLGIKNQLGMGDANSECRYREMGLLRYWFRAVEKFAPWVNKVFFVTCGQKPEWLDEANHKLVLVNHKEYIPSEWLPTFNTRPIELNLHKISCLSEHFVLFNDDTFLMKPVTVEFFFKKGNPIISSNLRIYRFFRYDNWSQTCFNDYRIVNECFDLKKSIWNNRHKWFDCKALGVWNAFINMMCFKLNKTMPVSGYEHIIQPHLKSTIKEVWNRIPEYMEDTCKSKFRSNDQVNQWLFCAWNQANGKFYPAKPYSRGKLIHVSTSHINEICDTIKRQSVTQLCLNDTFENDNPEFCFERIRQAFDSILPEKSSFEL